MTPEHLKKIAAIEGRGSDPVHPDFLASFEEVTGLELPESYKRFLTEYGRVWFGDGHGFHLFHEGEKRDGVTSIGYPTLPLVDAFGFRAVAAGDGEHHTDYFLVLEPGKHYGRSTPTPTTLWTMASSRNPPKKYSSSSKTSTTRTKS